MAAIWAGTIRQAIRADVVPRALNQQRVAFRAARVGGFAEDISLVDVMEPSVAGDFAREMQSFRRCARLVMQFEIRMKRGEMEGNIGTEVFENPFGELARFIFVIIQGRNHQVGDFKPHIRFFFQAHESFEHGREMRERNFSVEIFGERFEVDIGGVDVVVDFVKRFARDVSIRHHDGVDATGVCRFRNVDDVLGPNGGLVVSERDRWATVAHREINYLLRFDVR